MSEIIIEYNPNEIKSAIKCYINQHLLLFINNILLLWFTTKINQFLFRASDYTFIAFVPPRTRFIRDSEKLARWKYLINFFLKHNHDKFPYFAFKSMIVRNSNKAFTMITLTLQVNELIRNVQQGVNVWKGVFLFIYSYFWKKKSYFWYSLIFFRILRVNPREFTPRNKHNIKLAFMVSNSPKGSPWGEHIRVLRSYDSNFESLPLETKC